MQTKLQYALLAVALCFLWAAPSQAEDGASGELAPPPAGSEKVVSPDGAAYIPPAPALPALPEEAFAPARPALPDDAPPADDAPPLPPAPAVPADEPPAEPPAPEPDVLPPPTPAEVVPSADWAPSQGQPLERRAASRGLFGWCCPPVCPDCCRKRDECGRRLDSCGRPMGRWDITLEGLYSFVQDPGGAVGVPIANSLLWDPHEYDGALGGRLTVSYEASRCDRIEFRGAHMGRWDADSAQTGVIGFSPPPGGATILLDTTLRSRAELWTGELNWWREVWCRKNSRVDVVAGLRAAGFDESATVRGSEAGIVVAVVPGFVHCEARNRFYMAQVGGAYRLDLSQRAEVGVTAKVLAGVVDRDVEVDDNNVLGAGPHSASDSESDFAWGFELELYGLVYVAPRVALTGGYTMLYLDAVVRAHEGTDFTQATTGAVQARQGTSGLLSHTLFFGVRVNM